MSLIQPQKMTDMFPQAAAGVAVPLPPIAAEAVDVLPNLGRGQSHALAQFLGGDLALSLIHI